MDDFISKQRKSERKYVDEDGAGTDTDPAVGTGGPETNFTFRRIDSENKIPVAVDREVRAPFEWTILFRNRENPKENMWMKMEREQTQIPQWVQVDPKRILLLEE